MIQWKASRPDLDLLTNLVLWLHQDPWGLHLLQSAIHEVNFSLHFTFNSPITPLLEQHWSKHSEEGRRRGVMDQTEKTCDSRGCIWGGMGTPVCSKMILLDLSPLTPARWPLTSLHCTVSGFGLLFTDSWCCLWLLLIEPLVQRPFTVSCPWGSSL